MHAALVIAGKDLKERIRDRSAIVLGFIAPVAIASLMSLALGSTSDFDLELAVVDEDGGPLGAAFVQIFDGEELAEIATVEPYDTRDAASSALEAGDVEAVVVVPAGFSSALTGGAPDLEVLGTVDEEIDAQVAVAIAEGFVAQINANRLSVETALATGAPPGDVGRLGGEAAQLRIPEQIETEPAGTRPLEAISYYGPSMAIFFLLFAIGFGSRSFFAERREATLERMAAAPVRPATILAGKSLSIAVYGSTSFASMVVVTSAAFGADWGPWWAAGAVGLAMVLAVVALTTLVIALSRTERQAEGVSSVIVFGLALLGGNFIFVSIAPEVMRRLALLTPNGWALRAFTDLSTSDDAVAAIALPLVAIVAFTAAVGAVAAVLSRRVIVR